MTPPEHRPQPDRESDRTFSPETATPGPEPSAHRHSRENGNPENTLASETSPSPATAPGPEIPAYRHSRENGNPENTLASETSPSPATAPGPEIPAYRHSRENGNPENTLASETPSPPAAADRHLANGEPAEPPAHPIRLPIYRDFILLQLAAIVFLADQFTKFLVREFIPFGYSWPLWLGRDIFQFTHTHNTGSIFGILQGQNTPLIFVSFLGVFVLLMIYRSQPRPTHLLRLSLGLQLGGAFGNLIDRLRLGAVTDFIDVSRWPVFNLADASIVTGLLLLAWFLLRANRPDATAVPPSTDPTDAANPPAADPTPAAAAAIEPPDPAEPTNREPSP